MSYEERQLEYELAEKQKSLWRIEIANSLNRLGVESWLALKAMDNSIMMANLLNFVGISTATSLKTAWLSKADSFSELPSDSERARQTYDDFRGTAY